VYAVGVRPLAPSGAEWLLTSSQFNSSKTTKSAHSRVFVFVIDNHSQRTFFEQVITYWLFK
jgi:hypothetical protein